MVNNKLILFDIDDTLFDNYDYKMKSREKTLSYLLLELKKYNINKTFEELVNILDIYYRKDTGSSELYEKLVNHFNIPEENKIKLITELVIKHRSLKFDFKLCSGVIEILNNLKNKNFVLGIASSGNGIRQWEKLIMTNIENYFETKFVFITSEINSKKRRNCKDKKFYKLINSKLKNYNFEKIYMIGNKLTSDIIESRKVGFKSILVKSYCFNQEYELTCKKLKVPIISNLLQLTKVLENY